MFTERMEGEVDGDVNKDRRAQELTGLPCLRKEQIPQIKPSSKYSRYIDNFKIIIPDIMAPNDKCSV